MKALPAWGIAALLTTHAGSARAESAPAASRDVERTDVREPGRTAFIWDGLVHAELQRSEALNTLESASFSVLERSTLGLQRTFANHVVVGARAHYSWYGRKHSGSTFLVVCSHVGYEFHLRPQLRVVPSLGVCYMDRQLEGVELFNLNPFLGAEGLVRLTRTLALSYGPRFTWFSFVKSNLQGTESSGWGVEPAQRWALSYDLGLRFEL